MRRTARIGAAQVAPVIFDVEATLEKTLKTVAEAGRLGLDLVVFPETYFTAYPYWRGHVTVRQSTELAVRMMESAVRWNGPEMEAVARAARDAGTNVVIGINEKDDRTGSETIYNTLVFISRDGRILGRHRKLMPTHSERVYWGMGDARDLRVFDFDFARVGGLICYEHHMSLLRAALAFLGEEVHVAVWPGWWSMRGHLGAKYGDPTNLRSEIDAAIREYAVENQAFVVSASWYLAPEAVPPDLKELMGYNLAVGGSCVVNPSGLYLAEPVFGQETIVWAEIDRKDRLLAKAYFDCAGHYSRFDVVNLQIQAFGWEPYGPAPAGQGEGASPRTGATAESEAGPLRQPERPFYQE
jgi:nitrilase